MVQDVRFVMADRVCPGSLKNYAAQSARREDVDQGDVAIMSESGSGSRRSLTVATTEDDALCPTSTVAPAVFRSVDLAVESSERPESLDSQREVSPQLQRHSPRQLLFVHPGHEEVCSFPTRDSNPLVPNIVVECTTTRDAHGHRLTPPFVQPALSQWSFLSPVTSSRQIRALSDSSVYELERSPILHSSYIPSVSSESRHLDPYAWRSLSDVGEKGEGRHAFTEVASEVTDLRTAPSLLRNIRKSKTSRLSAVIEPEQDDAELYKHKQTDLPTVPFHWHSHSHKTRFSQGKSPKTYWMRRHSDSNLTNRPLSGLRPEPYPIRSRSTGDSIPSSAVLPESSAPAGKEVPSSEKEEIGTNIPTLTKRQPSEEKSAGLYEKRLKLKKYLQTRYQTSLLETRQSGDADDVFTDRTLDLGSPGPVVSPASEIRVNIPQMSPTSDYSHMGRKTVQGKSDLDVPEQVFCYERQMPGRKKSKEGYSCEGVHHSETCEHGVFSEKQVKGAKEGSVSSPAAATCSSAGPMFLFPVMSALGSDPVVSPSWCRRHVAQGHVSSGGLIPQSEAMEPAGTSWAQSEGYKPKSAGAVDSPYRSHGEAHCYQKPVSKQPEMHGAYSHFPLLVDLPAEKPSRRGYLRCSPWESSDRRTPTSALTRPQSHSSLVTHSSIAEQPSYPLTRFPSSPALSECPTASSSLISSWREPRDTSPRLVSSPSVIRAPASSDRPLVMRHTYSPLCESGPDRDESAAARSQFTCPLCSQEFLSYNHLTNHMSTHLSPEIALKESPAEGLKVHLCKVCNRAFSRSDMLTRHTRLHTGLRPYECHLCGQVFSRSDHLHTHLRTHTGEKPYKCTSCPYAAPRRDMVTRHMRIHTRDVPRRSRRSSSVSSDVPASPLYADLSRLSSEEVCRRIQSLSGVEPTRADRSLSLSHDSSTSASMEATEDVELGLVNQILGCRTCSLTSSESTEGSDFSHVFPTCHTWSSTSAESFESFSSPRMREHLSWSSSTESPDVFCRTPQQFFWSVRGAGHRSEKTQRDSSSSAVETLSIEMQTSFERCTVTTPERDSHEVTGETKPYEKYGKEKVKLEEESTFDKDKDC